MKKIKRTLRISLYFCALALGFASCNDKDDISVEATPTEITNKDAVLAFKMPVKKLVGGEVLLAGKLSGKWGGMYIYQRSKNKKIRIL